MLTVDTAKLEADISAFNSRLSARFQLLGGRQKVIVKRQAGLLCRTLINITPPRDRKKTADKITAQVNKRFQKMGEDNSGHIFSDPGPMKAGRGNVRWYAFSPKGIYGIAKDVDFTDATADQLYMLYFGRKLNSEGRFIAGRRGKQVVKIWQRITVNVETVRVLIKRLIGHIGRLKASFLPAWKASGSPGRAVPQWISQHEEGARGYAIDGLASPNSPEFTVGSTAEGAGSTAMAQQARAAVQIRFKAMENDIVFAIQHPDKWSEREAASNAAMEDA